MPFTWSGYFHSRPTGYSRGVGLLECHAFNGDDGSGIYATATIFAYISGNELAASEKTIVHTQIRDY